MEEIILGFLGNNAVFLLLFVFLVVVVLAGVRIVPQSDKFVVERFGPSALGAWAWH